MVEAAGVELAPHNILVVGVGPGAVATPINLSTIGVKKGNVRLMAPYVGGGFGGKGGVWATTSFACLPPG